MGGSDEDAVGSRDQPCMILHIHCKTRAYGAGTVVSMGSRIEWVAVKKSASSPAWYRIEPAQVPFEDCLFDSGGRASL